MIEDAARLIARDSIEHLDHGPDLHLESGLFEHLARDTGLERLADFNRPARDAPLPRQRFVPALHEHDAALVHDHRTDAHVGSLGILASLAHRGLYSIGVTHPS